MSIKELANKTIPPPKHIKKLIYAQGQTKDIIAQVLNTYKASKGLLDKFAPHLKGSTTIETCSNIWNFWKNEITYKVDPEGVQWAKTPAAVWASKYCDCKSFSIAVATTLSALGIDSRFRFTSYGRNITAATHVYVIAMPKGEKEIIIDCVWDEFNSEKRFAKNWDYMATKIYQISGIEDTETYALGELNIDVNDTETTQAELDLAVSKQKLELEQHIARKKGIAGLNSAIDNAYQIEIEAHNAALGAIAGKRGKVVKKTATKAAPKKAVKAAKKTENLVKKNDGKGVNKKQAKKLQKAGVTVIKRKEALLKRVAKGIKKVATGPALLALKSQLPKNAPFFLYLFLDPTNNALFAQLPAVVKAKREKALKYKNLLVQKMQMKEANFNTIVRNGIMKNFDGKTPEAVLAQWMQEQNFKVGILPLLAAAGSGIKALLGKAGEALKADIEQFSPTPEDFGNGGESPELKKAMADDVQDTPNNNDVTTGKGSVKPTDSDGTTYNVQNSKSTAPSTYDNADTSKQSTPEPVQTPEPYESSETGKPANGGSTGVESEGKGTGTILIVAALAGAAMLMSK